MAFILGLIVGVVVSGVAFILFYKNNLKKIEKTRIAIGEAYKGSPLEEAANKILGELDKHF